jgi:hypothetical protein
MRVTQDLNSFGEIIAHLHCSVDEQNVHHHRHRMMTPTMYRYCAKEDDGLTEGAYCSCTAGHTMIMFIKPTRINLKGICNSTLTQNVVVASLVVLQNIIL